MPLQVQIEETPGGVQVVGVAGELDHAEVPVLEKELDRAVEGGVERLVLDLRECTFIDSTGLGLVVSTHRRLGSGKLVICCLTDTVKRLFELTALDDEMSVFENRDEAIGAAAA